MDVPPWFYKLLIGLGFLLIAGGVLFYLFPRLTHNWPKLLPGDIYIKRPGMAFYFPIVSSIVFSLLLSLFFWLIRR